MTPLYNHTSFETSYLVTNYPWGFEIKTERQSWIEFKKSKGYRFCYRTKDPADGHWCAQKNSQYHQIAMCMYLDEKEHVSFSSVTEFSEAKDIKAFAENFPEAVTERLKTFTKLRGLYYKRCAEKPGLDENAKVKYLADATAHLEIFS